MEPKPRGWSAEYGSAFVERSVVERYGFRPPYPGGVVDALSDLARGRAVLEAGCGIGELARALAARVARVDAVDASAPMLERARSLPGGDAPNIRWILGAIERAALRGPYALIFAAQSIHWFDWDTALPRLERALEPDGMLALVNRDWLTGERLKARLAPIWARHSSNPDFEPLDPVVELERRGLFRGIGSRSFGPEPWRPTLDELLACQHSTSGFALERQPDAAAFDAELTRALDDLVGRRDGRYDLDVTAEVVWGRPGRAG